MNELEYSKEIQELIENLSNVGWEKIQDYLCKIGLYPNRELGINLVSNNLCKLIDKYFGKGKCKVQILAKKGTILIEKLEE